ncbi:hypothetical protein KL920_000757 [Ogataea angusta]|nr:hypothetical protein KL920_000757 [Ogataea angusta]
MVQLRRNAVDLVRRVQVELEVLVVIYLVDHVDYVRACRRLVFVAVGAEQVAVEEVVLAHGSRKTDAPSRQESPQHGGGPRGLRVQQRAAAAAHQRHPEQRHGADLAAKQPQAPGQGQGLRPPLQHDPRERQGDLERDEPGRQKQEDDERTVRVQDVPQRRLCDCRSQAHLSAGLAEVSVYSRKNS